MLPAHLRRPPEEENNPDLILGNVIISDYANSRVLDRLSIYERRIESSLFKTMGELKRLQLMREVEKQKAKAEAESNMNHTQSGWKGEKVGTVSGFVTDFKSGPSFQEKTEAATRKNAKQSQFTGLCPETRGTNL